MGAKRRSPEPLPGITHGPGGYKLGCGCPVCSDANAEGQVRWKAKQRGENPTKAVAAWKRARAAKEDKQQEDMEREIIHSGPDEEARWGERERLIRRVIAGYGELDDEAQSIASLAILQAKLIDTLPETRKWHLMGTTVRTLRDLMKELKQIKAGGAPPPPSPAGGGSDDFAASLRKPGES